MQGVSHLGGNGSRSLSLQKEQFPMSRRNQEINLKSLLITEIIDPLWPARIDLVLKISEAMNPVSNSN